MKKILYFLTLIFFIFLVPKTALAAADYKIYFDGELLVTEIPPKNIDDRICVPLRAIVEQIGISLEWNPENKTVTAKKDDLEVVLTINSNIATINGKEVILDIPATIINDRTCLPLRFVSETFGVSVSWCEEKSAVNLLSYPSLRQAFASYDVPLRKPSEISSFESADYSAYGAPPDNYLFSQGDSLVIIKPVNYEKERFLSVNYYDSKYKLIKSKKVKYSYEFFGGIHLASDGNFYAVYGNSNAEKDNFKTIYTVIKYNAQLEEVASCKITGEESSTIIPFRSSNVSISDNGEIICFYMSRERYATKSGVSSQSNFTIKVKMANMEKQYISELFPSNHVSSSFTQFVGFDKDKTVYVDLGCSSPRAVVIDIEHQNKHNSVSMFKIAGELGDNATGCTLGGLGISSGRYFVVGNATPHFTGDSTKWKDVDAGRNIFIASLPSGSVDESAVTLKWLTNYNKPDNVFVKTPHIVPLNNDSFFIMWNEVKSDVSSGNFKSTGLRYTVIDRDGNALKEIQTIKGAYFDELTVAPALHNFKIVWFVNSDDYYMSLSKRTFFELRLP